EVLLRLTGWALQFPSDARNAVRPDDRAKVRILAIGESTTADFFADEARSAWPRRLEHDLSQAGLAVRVYNEGVGSTSTPIILTRLPDYLEKYRPDIVITMMGINDTMALALPPESGDLGAVFARFRLVRIARWIVGRIESLGSCRF